MQIIFYSISENYASYILLSPPYVFILCQPCKCSCFKPKFWIVVYSVFITSEVEPMEDTAQSGSLEKDAIAQTMEEETKQET